MARPALKWLITDTHLHHDFMVNEGLRPAGFEKMIIKAWRHLVAPQDITYHLGDVIFYQYPKLKEILDSVPGTKILLMGNHDHKPPAWYMRNGFAFATEMIVDGDVLLSHKPVAELPSWVRLNVHGHLHDGHRKYEFADTGRHKLLACEIHGYKPVRFDLFTREAK